MERNQGEPIRPIRWAALQKDRSRDRDSLTNLLILLTVAMTVIFSVLFSYIQWRGQPGLKVALPTATPVPPTPTIVPSPTPTLVTPTPPPATPTPRPATPTPPPATPTPRPATPTPPPATPTPRPATPTPPPATPTPRPATPTPTPTPSPTPGRRPPAIRIVIPTIGVDAKVVEVSWKVVEINGVKVGIWDTADHAVAHHNNSANPGEKGNVVMSGHHNTKGEVFRRLFELEVGADIFLHAADGHEYRYVVEENLLLPEEDASMEERKRHDHYMDPTLDATLTLISCWPYWSYSHRVVVIAKLAK